MKPRVPLFAASLEPYHDELVEAIERVTRSGRYILGPEVESFEQEFAAYLGVAHCVGVANGTDALTIALRALGIKPGDEVILPSFTFYATAEAAANAGAKPVFCDIDPETFCMTADTVRDALTPRTRAIVAVHLFGNVAPVRDLSGFGLPVLEDAAQAAGGSIEGVKAGALCEAATFSFFPSKNLGGIGDGGAVVTNDEAVAAAARRLRFHGSEDKLTFSDVGYNSRLDEVQAAALRVLLPHLDEWTARRQAVASAYGEAALGDSLELPKPSSATTRHAYHLYVARHERADEIAEGLSAHGVEARGYYRSPAHCQPGMAAFGAGVELPGTAEAARTNIALPMGPDLTADDVRAVSEAVAAVDA